MQKHFTKTNSFWDKKPKKDLLDFNKQIILGEIGAAIGAPIGSFIGYLLTSNPSIISGFAVAGSILGGIIFWVTTRILDEKRKKRYSVKNLASDIAYYTPAALLLVIIEYQPILYFLSRKLIQTSIHPVLSTIIAQLSAFAIFLVLINIYRLVLQKYFNKNL
jgi:hypothetical protein